MLKAITKDDGDTTEAALRTALDKLCLELTGVSACLFLLHDSQEAGAHEGACFNTDNIMQASYYLGGQVKRISEEIQDLVYPRSREAEARMKKASS